MPNNLGLNKYEKHFKQVLQYAPGMLGNDAVNFFSDNFKRQGWLGNRLEPWRKRRSNARRNKGRAILVDSGRLRRCIRVTSIGADTDVPYVNTHNEGFKLTLFLYPLTCKNDGDLKANKKLTLKAKILPRL